MKCCLECGEKLVLKECGDEGEVPFCGGCQVFRFPVFSTAISTAILNQDRNKILLLQQSNRNDYTLLAGYVTKGEDAENTLVREVKEEVGLNIVAYEFMRSRYFARTNTLMLNFMSIADSEIIPGLNAEVEKAVWFSFDDALKNIKDKSLAKIFLSAIIDRVSMRRESLRFPDK